jgi:hypothetical protein
VDRVSAVLSVTTTSKPCAVLSLGVAAGNVALSEMVICRLIAAH